MRLWKIKYINKMENFQSGRLRQVLSTYSAMPTRSTASKVLLLLQSSTLLSSQYHPSVPFLSCIILFKCVCFPTKLQPTFASFSALVYLLSHSAPFLLHLPGHHQCLGPSGGLLKSHKSTIISNSMSFINILLWIYVNKHSDCLLVSL